MAETRNSALRGVITAIATPIDAKGDPDAARFIRLARHLLANGCDGLNVLGTTGEATSFSVEQRIGLMTAVAGSGLPLARMMVGVGAAAIADAVRLTRAAADLGFAGALVLPPFYYKGVPEEGVTRYVARLAEATQASNLPIYLYHFPALSGVPYTVELVGRIVRECGTRIAGLKDSSGDLGYARAVAAANPQMDVFPSNEAALKEARSGPFAGCISATANLNADLCGRYFHQGDEAALAKASAIRALFDGKALVPGVKGLLAHIHQDPALAAVLPPLVPASAEGNRATVAGYEAIRG
jgi:4-hydroxy-tetrahydrodipicolinate synthase